LVSIVEPMLPAKPDPSEVASWEQPIGRRLRLRDLHVFFAVVQVAPPLPRAGSPLVLLGIDSDGLPSTGTIQPLVRPQTGGWIGSARGLPAIDGLT
jgi:hypothetical protein